MDVRPFLLPTDCSECARRPVPFAAELARLLGARVICLHVVEPVVPPVGWAPTAEALPVAGGFGEQLGGAGRWAGRRGGSCGCLRAARSWRGWTWRRRSCTASRRRRSCAPPASAAQTSSS